MTAISLFLCLNIQSTSTFEFQHDPSFLTYTITVITDVLVCLGRGDHDSMSNIEIMILKFLLF